MSVDGPDWTCCECSRSALLCPTYHRLRFFPRGAHLPQAVYRRVDNQGDVA
jgi:hypothetical protein